MISIIIPSYNSVNYLKSAINSVLQQTYNTWELIVVDDCSIDGTKLTIDDYLINEELKGRLKYYLHNTNRGVSAARNTGIKSSKGEFIAFLDADDIWYPRKLEKVIGVFQKYSDVDLVCHNEYLTINSKRVRKLEPSKFISSLELMDKGKVYRRLISRNFLSASAVVVKKSCIQNEFFDEKLSVGEDYDLWLRLSHRCRFYLLDEFLGEYRDMQDNALSKNIKRLFWDSIIIQKKNIVYTGRAYFLKKFFFLCKSCLWKIIKSKVIRLLAMVKL